MGMFDDLYFDCPKCGKATYIQLKICEFPMLRQWRNGTKIDVDEIFPEYRRHLIDPKYDKCDKCGSAFIFDCNSGSINIEIWDGIEELENPTKDYLNTMGFWLEVYSNLLETGNVMQISKMIGDDDIFFDHFQRSFY